MLFSRFDRYVDRHARAFTERLQEICRMPSVAARGTGMRVMAEAIEKLMQRAGAGTRSFKIGSGYPILFGECGAGRQSFVVYGHYDVAPVGQLTDWPSGPFAPAIVAGTLHPPAPATTNAALAPPLAPAHAYPTRSGHLPV